MHTSTRVDRQAIQGRLFIGDNLPKFALPTRVTPGAFEQMTRDTFDPFWIDLGDTARVEFAGIDQLSRHNPFAGFFQKLGARVNQKPNVTSP